jgi:hypothetical protein
MALASQRVEIPVTTLADGTALIFVNPWYPFSGAYIANGTLLPFAICAAGSTTLPFAVAPNYGAAGPFSSLLTQSSLVRVDSVRCSFICTQSPLAVQGKGTFSMFY